MVFDSKCAALMPVSKYRKIKEEEKKKKIKELRDALPVLTLREVRRNKIPFHEAYILELEEDLWFSSASYIRQLVEFQQDILEKYGKHSSMWYLPRLHDSKDMLLFLGDSMKKAEEHHYTGDYGGECDVFLKLAEHANLRKHEWVWLKEQILMQALEISKYVPDDGRSRALALFFYGRLLYQQLGYSRKVMVIMNEVNRLSKEIYMFTHQYDCRTRYYSLNNQARTILYDCFLEEARLHLEKDPKYTLSVIREAKYMLSFGERSLATFELFLLQSVAHLALKKIIDGCISIRKSFSLFCRMFDDIPAYKKIVNIVHNGIQTMRNGNTLKALRMFGQVRRIYTVQFAGYYINLIYKYLGKYYLCKGVPSFATPVFMVGYKEFHKLYRKQPRKYLHQLLEVRIFTACSAAQEFWPIYTKVVAAAGEQSDKGEEYMQELIKWKSTRKVLWPGCERLSYCNILHKDMNQALVNLYCVENYAFTKMPMICWADWTAGYDDSHEIMDAVSLRSKSTIRLSLHRVTQSELNLTYYPNAVDIRSSMLRRGSSDRQISTTSFKSMESIFL